MAQGEMKMEGGSESQMGANSAAYMVISNSGKEADRLVSAKADVSKAVEIHETVMDGDVMRMQAVQGGIEVPAGGQVELQARRLPCDAHRPDPRSERRRQVPHDAYCVAMQSDPRAVRNGH